MGVAFQILNDLNDWRGDNHNKLVIGGDILGRRPTVLWALALEGLPAEKQAELLSLIQATEDSATLRVARVRELYEEAGVFEKAMRLIEKHHERATDVARKIQPAALQRLMLYLLDTVLEMPAEPSPVPAPAAESPPISLVSIRVPQ